MCKRIRYTGNYAKRILFKMLVFIEICVGKRGQSNQLKCCCFLFLFHHWNSFYLIDSFLSENGVLTSSVQNLFNDSKVSFRTRKWMNCWVLNFCISWKNHVKIPGFKQSHHFRRNMQSLPKIMEFCQELTIWSGNGTF